MESKKKVIDTKMDSNETKTIKSVENKITQRETSERKEFHRNDSSREYAKTEKTNKSDKIEKSNKTQKTDVHGEKTSTDLEDVPRFVKIFWYNYKLMMITFNSLLIMLCGVCCLLFIFLFVNGEEPYINRSKAIEMRNFSVLVPIWGAVGSNAMSGWGHGFATLMLALGLMFGALGVLGVMTFRSSCFWTEQTSYRFHKYYVIFNLLTLGTFLTALSASIFGDSNTLKDANSKLLLKIKEEYQIMGENAFTQAINILMITGDCCGVHGPEDFSEVELYITVDESKNPYKFAPDSLYWPPKREQILLKIPPVCCKREIFRDGTLKDQYENMKECTLMNFNTKKANTLGCSKSVFTSILTQYGLPLKIVLALFVLLQLYVTAVCLLRALQHLDCTGEYEDEITNLNANTDGILTDHERKLVEKYLPGTPKKSRSRIKP